MKMESPLVKAIFLDRDGTLNEEKEYLHRWEDWVWLPGALHGLKLLTNAGYKLIVVSNQSGIARNYYEESAVLTLNDKINADLGKHGVEIDAFFHCPHHPDLDGICFCRKPAPGMILKAAHDLRIDLAASWLVGDKASDISAAIAAGCQPLLVLTGYGALHQNAIPSDVPVCANLYEAALYILAHASGGSRSDK